MWIKKISLKNFQSHKDTEIEFSQGYNCIVGKNDSGKSALMRALIVLMYNQPKGAEMFVSWWAKSFEIEIELSTGVKIRRVKGKSVNKYVIVFPDGKEIVFENFEKDGVLVPREVRDAIGITPFVIDSTYAFKLNYRKQKEAPFLLHVPDSTKAKALNKITGIDAGDFVLQDYTKDLRAQSAVLQDAKDALGRINAQIGELGDLPALKAKLDAVAVALKAVRAAQERARALRELSEIVQANTLVLELTEKKLEKLSKIDFRIADRVLSAIDRHILLSETLSELRALEERSEETAGKLARLRKIDFTVIDRALSAIDRYHLLREAIEEMIDHDARARKINDILARLRKIDFAVIERVQVAMDRHEVLKEAALEIEELAGRQESTQDAIKKAGAEYAQMVREYGALLRRAKKCPLCLSPVTDKVIENIISSYTGEK